jgi:hypothetical protein
MTRLAAFLRAHRTEGILFLAAFAVYAAFSGPRLLHQSAAPHFIYQAEAFLHGRLSLPVDPPNLEDWAYAHGHFYVSFPPFPAVVMLPFVALFGYQFNDTLFTLFFAAFNVVLIYRVLKRYAATGDATRTEPEILWLTGFYAVGTLALYMGIRGEVWFTAETMGVTFACLYLLAAHRTRHPFLAGLALAVVFFAMELFAPDGHLDRDALFGPRRREVLRKGLAFAAPLTVFAGLMMAMNAARFGSPLSFGHAHLYDNRVNAWVSKYGLFSFHYLERNLRAAFVRLPVLYHHPLHLGFDGNGMSLFLTTPIFLLLLWPRRRPRLHRALWLTVAAVAIPALFYQNDGWYQFGYRFSLDWTPFLFLLLAMGGRPVDRWFKVLGIIGVVMAVWGALVFKGGWLS